MAQIPTEVAGFVSGVLVYSLFCLFASTFLLWLVWIHNERTSYVALLSFFTSLSTFASICQQIHTITFWVEIKTAQFKHQVADIGNPELNIAGASVGVDLVLFYIQFYTYNVDAILVLLWATELAKSIFQLRSFKNSKTGKKAQLAAKGFAVLFPVLQVGLLRSSPVQSDYTGFMVLSNMIMLFSMSAGTLLLLAILVKYVHTKRSLLSWDVGYGRSTNATGVTDNTLTSSLGAPLPRQNIYDKWLVVRFSIAFLMLAAFQFVTILFELGASRTNNIANLPRFADTSGGKAKSDFILFVPGVTASLVAFVVFGTTRTFREQMWRMFVPRQVRAKYEEKQKRKRMPSVVVPRLQPPPGTIFTNISINKSPRKLNYNRNRLGTSFYSDTESDPRTPLTAGFGDIGLQDMSRRPTQDLRSPRSIQFTPTPKKQDDEFPMLKSSTLSQSRF